MTDRHTLRENIRRAKATFEAANDDYMRRLNDPDGYLPTHSGPGRLAWLQSVAAMERAADQLRAAEAALTVSPRFSLSPEATVHCEWHTFTGATETCTARSDWVILDAEDQDDSQYPLGFHFAHLCDKHAKPALDYALSHPDEP